jgi:pimeloyl-ACP methyl ester carboxylesterase
MASPNAEIATPNAGSRPQQVPVTDAIRKRVLAGLPMSERRLSLNGVSSAVLIGGEGSPIVLLHGPSGSAAHWMRVIPDLLSSHRIIAPDLPGHGASEPFAVAPQEDAVCGWLEDLIECTCDAAPVLIGQTLGGAIAARFAAERSTRARALVLVDMLGLSEFQPRPEFATALQAFLGMPTAETHDRLWSQCSFDLPALRAGLGENWDALKAYNLDRAQAPGRLEALSKLMAHFGMPAIPASVLARIAVPTALIWGREDRATPVHIAMDASARYGWSLRVIEAAGDEPAMDQPQAFLSALREIMADLDRQGGAA